MCTTTNSYFSQFRPFIIYIIYVQLYSVVVTTSNYESGCPVQVLLLNVSGCQDAHTLDHCRARGLPELSSGRGTTLVPKTALNIKVVLTGTCKLIDGCSLETCSFKLSVIYHLAYATAGCWGQRAVNSIAWLYRGPCLDNNNYSWFYS